VDLQFFRSFWGSFDGWYMLTKADEVSEPATLTEV
jgi:hypothetical protein